VRYNVKYSDIMNRTGGALEIRIERIKASNLEEFSQKIIQSAAPGQFIPITMQRAIAHTHNPLIDPDDVSLLIAYQGDELVGFFGMMPILLKNFARMDKVFFFTTWRVQPNLRGKSVGSLLMQEALSMGLDYVIVGSGPARKVCRKFGFRERPPLIYYELDLTGMSQLNPATWIMRLIRKIMRLWGKPINIENGFTRFTGRLLSPLTKKIFTSMLWRKQQEILNTCQLKEVKQVQALTDQQLSNLPPVRLERDARMVNWMLQYPWVVEPGKSPTEAMDFYFSDVRQRFENIAVELHSMSDEYRGFIVFLATTVRDKVTLKTLDVALNDLVDQVTILPIAMRYARTVKADQIDLPVEAVTDLKKSRLGKLLLTQHERIYQCYPQAEDSPLAQAWDSLEFRYSDGDMSFS
jgi:GNAT superfamily N-acetyltransferase